MSTQSSIMADAAAAPIADSAPTANTTPPSSTTTTDKDVKRATIVTRAYQQEMLEMSLASNIIIALDTGSGKTHIAILRIKHELEREKFKLCWFIAPTVALCTQQHSVLSTFLPVSVGIISGSHHPDQWKNRDLWKAVVDTHRVIVSTPQVLLDALRHGYIGLGEQIGLLIFDEAHHAGDKHPYNLIMKEFYFDLPARPTQGNVSHVNCRPAILGLSASPIYGSGDVEKAFRTIEANLDSKICTPQYSRAELTKFVHRPLFKHAAYFSSSSSVSTINPDPPFSTNLASLSVIIQSLDIEQDPKVISLRRQLARAGAACGAGTAAERLSPEYVRLDGQLSKTLSKQSTFTHKGLKDLERAASDILYSIGPWACDWFVWSVVEHAKKASAPNQNNPYGPITTTWRSEEKKYLLTILNRVTLSPVSYFEDDIITETSDKVRVLIQSLLDEKEEVEILLPSRFTTDDSESQDEVAGYSGIIFVQRRDAVIALAEVLRHHPATKDQFKIGTLLGNSENSYRHSMMDITRSPAFVSPNLVSTDNSSPDSDPLSNPDGTTQEDDDSEVQQRRKKKKDGSHMTLTHFKLSLLNLLISTAVAEEGIDIQACGHVVRWDPPQNMASWVQSRGRARRRTVRSCFTLMYELIPAGTGGKSTSQVEVIGAEVAKIEKWMALERRMIEMYVKAESANDALQESKDEEDDRDEDGLALRVESTGALINTHSAVSHLSHFCAIISRSGNADNQPIYDLDPPEYALGWHTTFSPASSSLPFSPLSASPGTLGPSTIPIPQSPGPWTSTVTLPRSLPIPQRSFTSGPIPFPNKLKAHRHAAFNAYKALFEWGLLNEHLLPFTGGAGAEEEEDVKNLLKDIEKRKGLVGGVGYTYDPWKPLEIEVESRDEEGGEQERIVYLGEDAKGQTWRWYISIMAIDGLEPLLFFTRRPLPTIERDEGPELWVPGKEDAVRVAFTPMTSSAVDGDTTALRTMEDDSEVIEEAREHTRMMLWLFHGAKMKWEEMSYAYLLLPVSRATAFITSPSSTTLTPPPSFSRSQPHSESSWVAKRQWLTDIRRGTPFENRRDVAFLAHADAYAEKYGYSESEVDRFTAVKQNMSFGRPFKFVGWQVEKLSEELEDQVRSKYKASYGTKRRMSQSKAGTTDNAGDVEMSEAEVKDEEKKIEIPYPLLIVEPFPPKTNFLHPPSATGTKSRSTSNANISDVSTKEARERKYLIPKHSGIALYSKEELEYANLIPSILRWLGNHLIVYSFRETQFASPSPSQSTLSSTDLSSTSNSNSHSHSHSTPLSSLALPLLTISLTASSSGEHYNYQRLETLGDTVLKFIVGIQLYAEYAMWHEGYLTRAKDHAVSNVKLAKENVKRSIFRWIIRDMMLGRKWVPRYWPITTAAMEGGTKSELQAAEAPMKTSVDLAEQVVKTASIAESTAMVVDLEEPAPASQGDSSRERKGKGKEIQTSSSSKKKSRRKKGKGRSQAQNQELSSKLLADVVESLIGAAYEHGGFDLGYECVKFFDLGLKWQPLRSRFDQILARACPDADLQIIPPQIADVESMIGYTFRHKAHLLEALTHASYQEHVATISYERLEFLGDGVLDMVVTDFLYHVPGKRYSPGHMHLRKSAVVNGHFLAYICLGLSHSVDACMPEVDPTSMGEDGNPWAARMRFEAGVDEQEIHLWQCLMHSSQQVMEDQTNTSVRYELRKDEIREALMGGDVFPWAGLTRLQAPKFFSDLVESIIGAVFVDSCGDMDVIRTLLRRIGILPVLERIVKDEIDILHPVSRLSMWASKNQKEVEYVFEQGKGNVSCVILVDGVEEVKETEKLRGKASQEEVKFAAAEKAIRQFRLRGTTKSGGIETQKKGTDKGKQPADSSENKD